MNNKGVTYKQLTPHPLLQEYVKTYWFISYTTEKPKSFEILPDVYFDMILFLENDTIGNTLYIYSPREMKGEYEDAVKIEL